MNQNGATWRRLKGHLSARPSVDDARERASAALKSRSRLFAPPVHICQGSSARRHSSGVKWPPRASLDEKTSRQCSRDYALLGQTRCHDPALNILSAVSAITTGVQTTLFSPQRDNELELKTEEHSTSRFSVPLGALRSERSRPNAVRPTVRNVSEARRTKQQHPSRALPKQKATLHSRTRRPRELK